jgi:hypothetical protein
MTASCRQPRWKAKEVANALPAALNEFQLNRSNLGVLMLVQFLSLRTHLTTGMILISSTLGQRGDLLQ